MGGEREGARTPAHTEASVRRREPVLSGTWPTGIRPRSPVRGSRVWLLVAALHRLPARAQTRPLLPPEGPRTGGEPSFAGRLPHPSWPCDDRSKSDPPTPRKQLPAARTPDRHRPEPPHHIDFPSKERPSVEGHLPGVHSRSPRRGDLRERPATAAPRSVLVVSRHLDGLLLQASARVLHRAPDRRVRRGRTSSRSCSRRIVCPSKPSLRNQRPAVTTPLARPVHRRGLPSRPSRDPRTPDQSPLPTTDPTLGTTRVLKALIHLRVR